MAIFNRSPSISLITAFLVLLLPVTTQAAGFLEKSFSCKVETNVEVTVIDDDQEGVEFLIDDCYCAGSASVLAELVKATCRGTVLDAIRKGQTRAQAQAEMAKIPWKLEGTWERYKLRLGDQVSATKTLYCMTTDQLSRYMAACLQSGLEGTP